MSKLEQTRNRKATHNFSSRINAKYLATLILFWRKQAQQPKSISELSRLSLETFADFLVLRGDVEEVQSYSAAMDIINKTGYNLTQVSSRNLAEALALESGKEEGINFLSTPDPTFKHKKDTKKKPVSGIEIDNATAIYEKLQIKQEQEKKLKEGLQNFTKEKGDENTQDNQNN